MANHPNRGVTPARRRFLEAAITNQGDYRWQVGGVTLREGSGEQLGNGEQLYRFGWIQRGFLYRITDAGCAAIGAQPRGDERA